MMMSQVLLVCCAVTGAATGQDVRLASVPPAAQADISGNLINTIIQRPVKKEESVRDRILDSDVLGSSRTCGMVTVRLLPDPGRAYLAVVLQGTSRMDTVGYQDQVEARTLTIADFEVQQPIAIDERGVHMHPILACAQARTILLYMTNSLGDPGSNAVDFGRRTFWDDRPQIQRIVAKKTERKTGAEFAQELRPQVEKASVSLRKALKVLADLGVPTQPLRWSTTCSHLRAQAGLVTTHPMTAPPEVPLPADVALRLHQSVLERLAQKNLPGKTYSALDLVPLRDSILGFLGSSPKTAQPGQDVGDFLKKLKLEPASITFSKQTPIEIDMGIDGFSIVLHGSSFHQGGNDYPARSIRARYRFEILPTETAFVRQGSVQVIARGADVNPDDARNKSLKVLLENSFNLFLPSRLVLPRITIPGERPIVLVPTHASSSHGWLTLGWTSERSAK